LLPQHQAIGIQGVFRRDYLSMNAEGLDLMLIEVIKTYLGVYYEESS